jgi:hypothetical protein
VQIQDNRYNRVWSSDILGKGFQSFFAAQGFELADKFVALSGRDTRSRRFLSMVYAISGQAGRSDSVYGGFEKRCFVPRWARFYLRLIG